ncbi:MAG: glycosyl transferase family 2 [Ruminococcaceae bacterium]|nr:glycosyl transferase family 2 [Oscillospiraceae bacterium]
MSKYKVAVYAICKNEEKFAERWMNSMSEADGIFVSDTGSTDSTVSKLRELGAAVYRISLDEWRFDTARNISLDFVPDDYDICVCTDLDEVFESGWRAELERVWTDKTTRARYSYTWSFKPDGTPDITFYADKIHARHGFKWVHPVHEVLEYIGDGHELFARANNIKLNHYPDSTKSRSQYLPLLELSVREDPDDDRNMHYLGREYMYRHRWEDCIATLKRHLALKSATWNDERAASMRFIARAYKALGDTASASAWLFRAIGEAPYLREAYAESAILAYEQGDFLKTYYMVTEAVRITAKPKTYINEGFAWDSTLYDIGSIAAYNIGFKESAALLAETALTLSPQNERIKQNADFFKKSIDK